MSNHFEKKVCKMHWFAYKWAWHSYLRFIVFYVDFLNATLGKINTFTTNISIILNIDKYKIRAHIKYFLYINKIRPVWLFGWFSHKIISIYISIYLFIHLSICLSIYLSIYLSTHDWQEGLGKGSVLSLY